MIKVYRAQNEKETFNEICYDCAKQKKEEGLHIQYDLLLSERTNEKELDNCSICDGDYFLDGRKKHERLHDIGCIC